MQLSIRPVPYLLPSYSLTGHLLSFLRCGLQYRYNNVGRLPTTEPIQLWFGQFIHGVMEEAYRRFDQRRQSCGDGGLPWPEAELDNICILIEDRLAAQGLRAWEGQGLSNSGATEGIAARHGLLWPGPRGGHRARLRRDLRPQVAGGAGHIPALRRGRRALHAS